MAKRISTSTKVSRNAPCPCGSGLKFKKCCMAKVPEKHRFPTDGPMGRLYATLGHKPRTPHQLAILADPLAQPRWLPWKLKNQLAALWTPWKVAALSDTELMALLAEHGVHTNREWFLAQARRKERAWDLAVELWLPQARRVAEPPVNLLQLCAVELWKRWWPQEPARDVLLWGVAEGFQLLAARRREEALEVWTRTWHTVRERAGRTASLEDVGKLLDWDASDVVRWLRITSVELCTSAASGDPASGARAVAFHEEVLALLTFRLVDGHLEHHLRASLADVMLHMGRRREGERMYAMLIRRHPRHDYLRRRMAEGLAYAADVAGEDEMERVELTLKDVHDWGVGVGDEADALRRRDLLRVYPPLEPASPVDRLGEVGRDLPWVVSHRIVAAGPTVVPRLLAILESAGPPDEDLAPSWAAVHAAGLLARLGVADGVRPTIRLLSICDPYSNAESRCIRVLRNFGATALEPLLAAHAAAEDPHHRDMLRQALVELGVQDQRTFDILKQALADSPVDASTDAYEYNDERAIPLLRKALRQLGPEGEGVRSVQFALEQMDPLEKRARSYGTGNAVALVCGAFPN